ncbi:sensor histidine kinase [Kribbella sp. ALI-6-A]|uniref:sensor histidine kinase n=1 Tax=Kribbella sp. ALI-6-A TaxID=1933817 RepID=UPI00117A8353|nr:sensor histidine kinase [Kribbella sp. ALI-6-A]
MKNKATLVDALADGARPGRSRPSRWGWLAAAIWLFYLANPLQEIVQHSHGMVRVVGVVALLLFAAGYMVFFIWIRQVGLNANGMPVWQRIGYLILLLLLAALMLPAAGQTTLTTLVYITAIAMVSLDLRVSIPVILVLLGGAELSMRLVPGWHDDSSYGLAIFLAALAVFGMRRAIQRSIELSIARQDFAELAVQEERNRFARDLHDILGHSLTVITVKAELAGRLISANPSRAAIEVAEVEQLARAALADVRAAVAGYRELSLAGELVAARSALDAAGIRADLPTTVDAVPESHRELFAWVVREGVTNVVRHSGARRCTIRLTATEIEVLDDGRGPAPSPGGHGLIGLRERADQVGGTLAVGQAPGGGFRLTVRVGP